MMTTVIDKSKVKDFNMFKGCVWREATPEEEQMVRAKIAEIKAMKNGGTGV